MQNHINLPQPIKELYQKCSFQITDFEVEAESKEYEACSFTLNGKKMISRQAKITPKKVGRFVTFWKRTENGPIEPYYEKDEIDFLVVNISDGKHVGQFVFPKETLVLKGIISTDKKEGKRAFRVYTPWDKTSSTQAIKTQSWQQDYFLEIFDDLDIQKVKKAYN